jgi:dethiobiotin synthetase
MKRYIVAGIGTDVGKTVASAVLTEYLQATYWKPVQAGDLDHTDRMKVQRMCGPGCYVLDEQFRLNTPASPHLAAELDGVSIRLDRLSLPKLHEHENLVIETAGGLMVPLNDEGLLYLDVIEHWKLPVFLVTKHYLGSINHTLLSLYALQQRKIEVAGLIVNGDRHEPSERIYEHHFPGLQWLFLPQLEVLSQNTIAQCAQQWKLQLG